MGTGIADGGAARRARYVSRPDARRAGARAGRAAAGCSSPLTMLTMIAASTPHQKVLDLEVGDDPVGDVEHQDVDEEVEEPQRHDDERDRQEWPAAA